MVEFEDVHEIQTCQNPLCSYKVTALSIQLYTTPFPLILCGKKG